MNLEKVKATRFRVFQVELGEGDVEDLVLIRSEEPSTASVVPVTSGVPWRIFQSSCDPSEHCIAATSLSFTVDSFVVSGTTAGVVIPSDHALSAILTGIRVASDHWIAVGR